MVCFRICPAHTLGTARVCVCVDAREEHPCYICLALTFNFRVMFVFGLTQWSKTTINFQILNDQNISVSLCTFVNLNVVCAIWRKDKKKQNTTTQNPVIWIQLKIKVRWTWKTKITFVHLHENIWSCDMTSRFCLLSSHFKNKLKCCLSGYNWQTTCA